MKRLSNEDFSRLVAEDAKGRISQEQKDYLRLPENWSRWQETLYALLDDLDEQIADLSEGMKDAAERYAGTPLVTEAQIAADSKLKKINRFKFFVEQRLAEVDRMIALGKEGVDDETRLAGFLLQAIQKHEDLIKKFSLEPTAIDSALWAAKFGRWEFNSITAEDIE